MKRLRLGAALAVAAVAAPASADPVEIQPCYATVVYPCGVCVDASVAVTCTRN